VIYIKRIILIQRSVRPSKEHILTKNRKNRSKTNKTKTRDRTGEWIAALMFLAVAFLS
jgi:hypothetical protein